MQNKVNTWETTENRGISTENYGGKGKELKGGTEGEKNVS